MGVSWDDAHVFMEKVNANVGSEDGGKMSLPTEAQYEYAARAGETGMYPGGSLDEVAWHDGNSGGYPKPVGTKKANAWGLHDMNGSAWEWVQDCYYEELPGGTEPNAAKWGLNPVIRGSCWLKDAANSRLESTPCSLNCVAVSEPRDHGAASRFYCLSVAKAVIMSE